MSDLEFGIRISANGGDQSAGEFGKVAQSVDKLTERQKRWSATADEANRLAEEVSKKFDALNQSVKPATEAVDAHAVALSSWTKFATAAAAAATGLAAAFVYKAKTAIDAAASMQTLSEKTGIAVEQLSRLKYAADLSDTSIDTVARALARLPKSLIEAGNANSESGRAFSFLGIDPSQLKDEQQAIDAIANAIQRVEDPMAKAAALQMIFKRNGEELIPFFNQGADGLHRLMDEGSKWATISGINAEQAKLLKDRLIEMQYASSETAKVFAANLVPRINDATKAFLDGAREGDKFAGVLAGIKTLLFGSGQQNAAQQVSTLTDSWMLAETRLEQAQAGGNTNRIRIATSARDRARSALDNAVSNFRSFDAAEPMGPPAPADIKGRPDGRTSGGGSGRGNGSRSTDAGAELIRQLQAKLDLDKQSTEVEKLQYDLDRQRYALITPAQTAEANRLAAALDLKNQTKAVDAAALEYAKWQIAEDEKSNAQLSAFNTTVTQHIQDLEFETATYAMTNAEKEKAIALRQLDMQYQAAQKGMNDGELETLKNTYDIERERLSTALDSRRVAAESAKQQAELIKSQAAEWNKLWTSVENTGKQAFVHIFSDGKNAFQSIGQALKASVIDLLYELTAKQWIIKLRASFGIPGVGGPGSGGGAGGGGGGGAGGGGAGSFDFGSLFSGNSAGSFIGSGFQNLGVATGSQGIADIGNMLNGLSNGNALGYLGAAYQLSQGNWGSAAGTAIGTYFGGPIGGAIGSALGGLVEGGGSTPSVLQGFHTTGSVDARGFHGSVTAGDQLGHTWAATGETGMVGDYVARELAINPDFAKAVAANPLAIDFTNGQDNSQIVTTLLAGFQQVSAAQKAATDAQKQAADAQKKAADAQKQAADAAAKQQQIAQLNSTQTSVISQLQSIAAGLSGQLGITSLQQFSDSLSTSTFIAPTDRLANAKSILSHTYARALAGDMNAVNAFPNAAQSVLTIGRDTYASGPQFADIFKEVNRELANVLKQQQDTQLSILKDVNISIQQAGQDQIGALRAQTTALVGQLKNVEAAIKALGV